MRNFKRFLTLALAAVLLLSVCLPALSGKAEAAGGGLVKKDGAWYYMDNGQIRNVTTLVKYNGEWWYVVNGKVASNTTSLVKYNNEWWYVVKGKVASNTTSLVKYNNEWWYVVKGKVASKTTSLVKYNNEWWYVVKGKIAANTTTLVKHNGSWYYIVKGKLAAKTTTLFHYNGAVYYIKNGKTQPGLTGLVKHDGVWYYVKKGVVAKGTAFVEYMGKKYFVTDGVARTDCSGEVQYYGGTYFIKNGVLTNCHAQGHSFSNYACKHCGVGDPKNAYKFLANWVKTNGTKDGEAYYISYNQGDTYVYLIMDEADEHPLYVAILGYQSGIEVLSTLNLDDYGYFFGVAGADVEYSMEGTIKPKTFTESTELTYKEYNGPEDYVEDVRSMSGLMVNSMVMVLQNILDAHGLGLDIADFGFIAYGK